MRHGDPEISPFDIHFLIMESQLIHFKKKGIRIPAPGRRQVQGAIEIDIIRVKEVSQPVVLVLCIGMSIEAHA